MNFILCDEPGIRKNLLPLTFTRPVALLRVGITTIKEKWEDFLQAPAAGFETPAYLQEKFPCTPAGAPALRINASFIPDENLARAVAALKEGQTLCQGPTWIACAGGADTGCQTGANTVEYSGQCLQIVHLWDIFTYNGKQIERDLERIKQKRASVSLQGEEIKRTGRCEVFAEEGARVDFSLLDTTEGPVYLGKNSRIMPGCYIKGPFALCENALVKAGAKIYEGCTFGPYCKVAGEVENSVFTGYSNKAHDGFIGDAVLGEWCNLGAGTNCSNLKNDYSEVRVWNYAEEHFVKTGLQFCGLFMGDHSKSAIGTQFNTGTVVGVAANVFAAGFPRNFIPSFTWGTETYRVERALTTARTVYARRNKEFMPEDVAVLRAVYEQTVDNRIRSQSGL